MDDILKGGRGRAIRIRKLFVNAIFYEVYLCPDMVNLLQK
jgi:hypothetical protein